MRSLLDDGSTLCIRSFLYMIVLTGAPWWAMQQRLAEVIQGLDSIMVELANKMYDNVENLVGESAYGICDGHEDHGFKEVICDENLMKLTVIIAQAVTPKIGCKRREEVCLAWMFSYCCRCGSASLKINASVFVRRFCVEEASI